ncbi:hypothetical protein [Marinoscillum sp. MHG1-6]|uniref:hypothetical protein n=1 Tax=Marinoscillum sp. MHG1-6 TaxID=2959627 RepID=UPI0021581B11|nr:hypothetical protein [Marinoscillum sp. MHG1-6]
MIKAINVLKVISSIVFLATLLFVYALLPVMVNINPEETGWSLHKEYFFYGMMIICVVVNIFSYTVERMLFPVISSDEIKSWIKGFSVVLNLYLAFLVGYVGVMNNPQHFEAGAYGYLNYLGPLLIFGWTIGLVFSIVNKSKTT